MRIWWGKMLFVDVELLRDEVKRLSRGRGIRRPDVDSWLGSTLQQIVGISAERGDEVRRQALIDLIIDKTAKFPKDLR